MNLFYVVLSVHFSNFYIEEKERDYSVPSPLYKCLDKFKRIEIISNIFPKLSGMKVEISYRNKNRNKQTCPD